MFFTCKNFMFSDFKYEKKNAAGNGEGAGAPLSPPCPPFPTALCVR